MRPHLLKLRGFTLIELLIALVILATLASIAFYANNNLLDSNRAESYLTELKRNITFARAKAAADDQIVILCPVNAEKLRDKSDFACQPSWANNAIATFVDLNNDGQFNSDEETIIRALGPVHSADTLKFTASLIRFDGSGQITSAAGKFVYCPSAEDKNNQMLTVTLSGNALFNGTSQDKCN
ncbi:MULTISPECIES: GspH/FimT family pseudopilin [Pseudoalteromonas]|uniref:Type II secretion system protein H n=1 Tax=Pseudoalteromonas amylolytica TaxID=1859457 RepID=A0A1S1MLS4_9GAMM|nr:MULTISPECIES: GspH/FimT family pseudopilin [Pseudoalteromonas]OHU86753.1 pilus assembly protein [Pseudoalteromonas sp. JW3]OHU88722.1 pilus assembly protein [Pseudoalteromonas amylolytica]